MMNRKTRRGCLVLLILLIAAPYVLFQFYARQSTLAMVPGNLKVSTIVYNEGENRGIGPGANETFLIVYELPEAIARSIRDHGVEYFYRPENIDRREGKQRGFVKWRETPMVIDRHWGKRTGAEIRISDYLDKYGFGIDIDPGVECLVDSALSSPGSFYAWGWTGLVIVAPEARRVVFVHAG